MSTRWEIMGRRNFGLLPVKMGNSMARLSPSNDVLKLLLFYPG
jgi:hypothetical protein